VPNAQKTLCIKVEIVLHIFGQPDICYHDSIQILKAEIAQVLIRNLEDRLKTRLQRHTKRHCHSMEAEARDILRNELLVEETPAGGLRSEGLRATGNGWQGRADEALRLWLAGHSASHA
jgi:plasmid stability protein